MKEDTYHRAKVAAVIAKKSLGQWIEEAIAEKLNAEAASPLAASKGQR
ncbi:MAG: 3-hydroxyacyl-CoA dehydrogenase [Dehalococcoidia bacterium]